MKENEATHNSSQVHEPREKPAMLPLTGLWSKTFEQDGETKQFLSGSIGLNITLLIFPNGRKRKPQDPDFNAFLTLARKRESE